MKTFFKSLLLTTFAAIMIFTFAACTQGNSTTTGGGTSNSDGGALTAPDTSLEINIYTLNGTTALGIAGMYADVEAGDADMNYKIEMFTSADLVTGPIVSGEAAIAALPTNAAAALFNKSGGKVKLLSITTLGVLYLLQNTETEDIKSFDDLKGKTVYVPGAGSNPEYITKALFDSADLTDVIIDNSTYTSPADLQTAIISGNVSLAVLPQPLVTVALTKNPKLGIAMDFTEKWEEIHGENTLAQSCLVVNTAFAEAHPAEVKKFLKDYEESINFIKNASDEAIAAVVNAGILPNAAIATTAIPKCNLIFIAGEAMKPIGDVLYTKLYEIDPQAIGGKVPEEEFYYIVK